jgi:hypothetical protein
MMATPMSEAYFKQARPKRKKILRLSATWKPVTFLAESEPHLQPALHFLADALHARFPLKTVFFS